MRASIIVSSIFIVFLALSPAAIHAPTMSSSSVTTAGSVPAIATPPLAAFTYEACWVCAVVANTIFFNANTTFPGFLASVVSYSWDFGDGTQAKTTQPTISHIFPSSSTSNGWIVTLTVANSRGQTDTISQRVSYNVIPRYVFKPLHPAVGQTVLFDGTSSSSLGASSTTAIFDWSFGDGASGTGAVVKHAYYTAGVYRVTLTFTSTPGQGTISKTIIVGPHILMTRTTIDGVNVTLSGSFTFNNTARTVSGYLTLDVVNATTGDEILSRSINFTLAFGSMRDNAGIVLTITLQNGTVDLGGATVFRLSTGTTVSDVMRDPDYDRNGRLDIVDTANVAYFYGTGSSNPNYRPKMDLNADGTINILDVALLGLYYDSPVQPL